MDKDKETLLVTGGLGFIGSHVVEKMRDRYKIIVVDYDHSLKANELTTKLQNHGVEVHQKDITDPKTWTGLPACEYIFHAAAQVAAEKSWGKTEDNMAEPKDGPIPDFQTNAFGTFLVAEYARKHNAHIIYCNSIRVYDPDAVEVEMEKHGKVSEECSTINMSIKPQPPFALSKYFGEQYLQCYSNMYGLNVISLRMSGIVGAGQPGSTTHGWLANIVRCANKSKEAIEKNEQYIIYGDGNQTRDILHINDFIDLIENQLANFKKYSEGRFAVYNVGGGPANELSINQVIELLNTEFSSEMTVAIAAPRIGEPRHYCTDLTKIKKKGWPYNNIISTKEIISEVVRYYRSSENKRGEY